MKVRETEKTAADTVAHPDVVTAYKYHDRRVFSGDYDLVFWTNDTEPDPTVPGRIIRWGRRIAEEYRAGVTRTVGARAEAHVMGDFEGPGAFCGDRGVFLLDDYGKDAAGRFIVSPSVRDGVAVMASYSFAKSASGTVVAAAKGAYHYSFFREVELDALMKNADVTHITLISRPPPDKRSLASGGERLDKYEAYHTLRKEWLEYSYKRCIDARNLYRGSPSDVSRKAYDDALNDLATERLISIESAKNPYPAPPSPGTLPTLLEGTYRENERIRISGSYFRDFPPMPIFALPSRSIVGYTSSLEEKVENPILWRTPSFKVALIKASEKAAAERAVAARAAAVLAAAAGAGRPPAAHAPGTRGPLAAAGAGVVAPAPVGASAVHATGRRGPGR